MNAHIPTRAASRPYIRCLTAPAFFCILVQAPPLFPDAPDLGTKSQCQSRLARALAVSLTMSAKPICVGGPIVLVGALKNVGDEDLLLADPDKCRTCLFFEVEDSSGRTVSPIRPGGPVRQVHESKPALILLKAGSRAEFSRDIAARLAGMEQHWLAGGKYRVAATFINPGGLKTAPGPTTINGVVKSPPLEIIVGECMQ